MSENTKKNSSFENSLLYRAYQHVLNEVRSPFNQWEAGKHFKNDPRDHPGERLLHYTKTGRVHQAIEEFKENHQELRRATSKEIVCQKGPDGVLENKKDNSLIAA